MGKFEDWVKSGKPYEQGLAMLAVLTRNRVLLQSLARKRNPDKLRYELKKLLKTSPEKLLQKPLTVTVPAAAPEKKPVTREEHITEPVIRTRIIHKGKEIRYEDLPERLRVLYDYNRIMYKEMRALHEKAKLAKSDAAREPLAARLVLLDTSIRANWNTIDSWDGQPDVEAGNIDHRRINANRKFISDNKKLLKVMDPGPKKEELLKKLQARVDELLDAGESLDRVKKELESIGVKF